MGDKGILIIISGFSGSGKGTIVNRVMSERDTFALSVSMTTRKPREGEVDKISYFFVTREEFEDALSKDAFLESNCYATGDYYGTPKKYVIDKLEEGYDVILEIDPNGAMMVKEKYPEAILIFVTPPSAFDVKKRLELRATESPDKIAKRINQAKEESKKMTEYDYILVNDKLDLCVKEFYGLVDAAHRDLSNRLTEYTPLAKAELINKLTEEFKAM